MITQEELKESLNYNPDTGIFIWRIQLCNRIKVGGIAGCIRKSNGYTYIGINQKQYLAHRLARLYITGSFPKNQIDHKDQNRSNNVFSNFEDVTHKENGKNQKKPKNNTSGMTGVDWNKPTSKWRSRIMTDKKERENLGYFDDWFDAVCARKSAENKYGYSENHGK